MKIKFRYIFSLLLLIFGIYEMIHWYVLKDTKEEREAIRRMVQERRLPK